MEVEGGIAMRSVATSVNTLKASRRFEHQRFDRISRYWLSAVRDDHGDRGEARGSPLPDMGPFLACPRKGMRFCDVKRATGALDVSIDPLLTPRADHFESVGRSLKLTQKMLDRSRNRKIAGQTLRLYFTGERRRSSRMPSCLRRCD